MFTRVFLLFGLMFFLPGDASAYIDPGTGTLVVQAIVGLIAAAALFFRNAWAQLLARVMTTLKKMKEDKGE